MTWSSLSKGSKYHAQKTIVDGIKFDSKKEAERYSELKLLEKAGKIQNLELQVEYELIPPFKSAGRVIERACKYRADFRYTENGETIVEDAKGLRTEAYKIKRKLLSWRYGIIIRET